MEIKDFWPQLDNSLPLFIEGEIPNGFKELEAPEASREGISKEGGAAMHVPPFLLTALAPFGAGPINNEMNLFILGGGIPVSSELDLTIFNQQFSQSINLFIGGLGITHEAIPIEGTMNLFLTRDEFSEIMPLFISGYNSFLQNYLNCVISGTMFSDASMFLVLPNVSGILSENVPLYINGY